MGYTSDLEQKRIFSNNLLKFIEMSGKQQKDIAIDLDVNPPTFNTWCTGKSIPPVNTIQKIADYFNIGITALVNEQSSSENTSELGKSYYLDNETANIAYEIKNNDKILFDAYNSTNKERLVKYAEKLMELEKMENGEDD